MSTGIDVFHLFPELAAIGQPQLQVYCDDWLRRPMAKQFAVAQLFVDEQLLLSTHMDAAHPAKDGDLAMMPIDQLLGYIVDRHFTDAEQRRRLHESIRDTRKHWGEFHRDYMVTMGRKDRLYLKCKNPDCRAELETTHEGIEGQAITCPPTELTCPVCGASFVGDGNDLHLRLDR